MIDVSGDSVRQSQHALTLTLTLTLSLTLTLNPNPVTLRTIVNCPHCIYTLSSTFLVAALMSLMDTLSNVGLNANN